MKSGAFGVRLFVACMLSFFGYCLYGQVNEPTEAGLKSQPSAINNVTIVDVVGGNLIANQTVLISGDRIKAIGKTGTVDLPPDTNVIDGRGKFAIPGLWDMHVHWMMPKGMDLFPANGVTGVRLMWGYPMHQQWRKDFEDGTRVGPRLMIASRLVDGPNPYWPGCRVAEGPEDGVEAVQEAVEAKADFVKVYSLLSRETYLAIVAECKKQNLPFAGHVPRMVAIGEASDAGQRSVEHMYEVELGCSREEGELRKQLTEQVAKADGNVRAVMSDATFQSEFSRRVRESFDEEVAEKLFAKLKANQTWQCPTLTVLRNLAYITDDKVQNNPNLKYIPRMMAAFIAPKKDPRNRSTEAMKAAQNQLKNTYRILKMMDEAQVPIIAGTDVLNPFCLPGFSLHTELQLMVEAGLSPAAALRTATINPAKFQGKEKTMGSISTGKVADIVLLNENPLQDISATTKINSVWMRGRLLDRKKLDSILQENDTTEK